jgi:hypothetical protein
MEIAMERLHRRDMLKSAFTGLALPFPLMRGLAGSGGEPGDELLLHEVKLLLEMDDQTYRNLWGYLRCLAEEELDWRPHPEANSLRWVVGHLNWFEEWVADAIDGTGMYLDEKGGPTSSQERPIARQKERFDAARARLATRMRARNGEGMLRPMVRRRGARSRRWPADSAHPQPVPRHTRGAECHQ